jgi:cyclase
MIKITEKVFAETKYTGCNIGWVNTEQGLVLVDTPALLQDIQNLKQQLNNWEIVYTVYTHEHFDHLLGGALFSKHIIAHKNVIPEIEHLKINIAKEVNTFFPAIYGQYKDYIDNVKIVNPQILFDNKLTLNMGNRTLELMHVGGHSSGSIFVFIPEDKVLFCGDNLMFGMPAVPPNPNFEEWIALLARILAMDIEKIVPGHGEICGKNEARKFLKYFQTMHNGVLEQYRLGMTKIETIKNVNISDCLPVPMVDSLKMQVAYHIGLMYDEVSIKK